MSKLLEMEKDDEVYVQTKYGLKKVKAVIPTESDMVGEPRYYTELMIED